LLLEGCKTSETSPNTQLVSNGCQFTAQTKFFYSNLHPFAPVVPCCRDALAHFARERTARRCQIFEG
jgi:hypothetical protein